MLIPVLRAGYLGSMAGTLYAALVMHSYVMSLICCAAQARHCPLFGLHSHACVGSQLDMHAAWPVLRMLSGSCSEMQAPALLTLCKGLSLSNANVYAYPAASAACLEEEHDSVDTGLLSYAQMVALLYYTLSYFPAKWRSLANCQPRQCSLPMMCC